MGTTKRMGRPPKADKLDRSKAILLRLTSDEKARIESAARGVSVVEWARRTLLAASPAAPADQPKFKDY